MRYIVHCVISVCILMHTYYAISATDRTASVVMDIESAEVLHSHNADEPRYPASLTKIMTIYLAFEALEAGVMKHQDKIRVSSHAASQPRTNMNLKAGEIITVKDAIMGMIVHSSNDAAVAIAEEISGSEKNFAELMNRKARALGMYKTSFRNATGLPHPEQKTTAYDMAKLGIAMKNDFSKYYKLFSVTEYTFKGRRLVSHNHVVKNYQNIDGLKTGYINASGYNLVSSASDRNQHVIGVVMGGNTARERDNKMVKLLNKFVEIKSNFVKKITKSNTSHAQKRSAGKA
jgi:D-alanyl-D-alanine carboxypeptidase